MHTFYSRKIVSPIILYHADAHKPDPFHPVFAVGPRAERFTLNPNTGELRSSSPLSHSERPEYNFIVLASDRGSPAQSSTITLKIQVR